MTEWVRETERERWGEGLKKEGEEEEDEAEEWRGKRKGFQWGWIVNCWRRGTGSADSLHCRQYFCRDIKVLLCNRKQSYFQEFFHRRASCCFLKTYASTSIRFSNGNNIFSSNHLFVSDFIFFFTSIYVYIHIIT